MNRHRCAVWRPLALFPSSLRSSIRASVASLAAVSQGVCVCGRARVCACACHTPIRLC